MTKEEVLAKLMFDVELRGLSKNTQSEYYFRVRSYQNHYDRPATELGEEDIRQFLHYLTTEKKLVSASVNTYNSALRFLYGVTLNTKLNLRQILRHRKQRKFPHIFTKEEVQTLFDACNGFVKIRHYGILCSNMKSKLLKCRKLTGSKPLEPVPHHYTKTCRGCGGSQFVPCYLRFTPGIP